MIYFFLAMVPAMAWCSRMAGGGKPDLPFRLARWLFCAPFAVLLWPLIGWYSVIPYLCAVLGKSTGHGNYQDLGTWRKPVKPEKLDFIVRLFYGADTFDNYWRDAFGLAVTGMAVTAAPGMVMIATGHLWGGMALLFGGEAKSIAYMIGWKMFPTPAVSLPNDPRATEFGEFLTGMFAAAGLFIAYVSTI